MKALKKAALLSRTIVFVYLVGVAGYLLYEGYENATGRIVWFIAYNVCGWAAVLIVSFLWNVYLAPGKLLSRDIVRTLVVEWLGTINSQVAAGGVLMERIRLGDDIDGARRDFETWTVSVRSFLQENLTHHVSIFDDPEMGPFGPLLDLPTKLRASLPSGFAKEMERREPDPREALIEMISRRRANLQRIRESLLPMTISGEPPHARN